MKTVSASCERYTRRTITSAWRPQDLGPLRVGSGECRRPGYPGLHGGRGLSERKLAAMFGKTSRRWARHRMAEAMGRAVG